MVVEVPVRLIPEAFVFWRKVVSYKMTYVFTLPEILNV